MSEFVHLHNHTQYSLLDGASRIDRLMEKTQQSGMKAIAITDHGNMFGVFDFVAQAQKHKIKPIVGCEFYMVEDRHIKKFSQTTPDRRYHQLLLAKNEEGYRNLTKLCSLGFIEGLYSKWPRIDRELILKYHTGLIATTCCIGAEIPQTILNRGEEEAELKFKWWLDIFGEDYYIELQRHDLPEQHLVNNVLMKFAAKYKVPMIASNDSHYVEAEDASAHDILLCINTGDIRSTPKGDGKGYRFGFPNEQFYYKTPAEMSTLFQDIPEAIENTLAVADKIDNLNLSRDIMLPNFPIPDDFKIHQKAEYIDDKTTLSPEVLNQWEYLKHLAFEGAQNRYKEITPEIEERLTFELFTIKTMGFAGYFLIVADFIRAGREMGVYIGPGRGSAAGSVVAYCIGITNIDPIKYNLLFERFLNPERKSMPDIDTDFDDIGRQQVIDYVVQKYGKEQVAQIITYGTMAAKMSIKDVARALDLPLAEANVLAKLVPERAGISLQRVLKAPLEGEKSLKEKENLSKEELEGVITLRKILEGRDLKAEVLREALTLEGSVRSTGIHAAGIIIAPEQLFNIIPVALAKDSELLVTQYEGNVIESAGVIKMDFLGLKNLTIIKSAVELIRARHGIEIQPDEIPLDDQATLDLFKRGETIGTFQFESPGMQKYLKDLKPDKFEDLIAMNALYRPGPIDYIPNYVKRKNNLEPITYDLPEMEEFLQETYGITVYQEQVMLLSQKLAGFTKGQADSLRKAMGKKDRSVLDKLKPLFLSQAQERGLPLPSLEKIWTDWEAFASYAFNKSHSTCYAFVAFQTGYLKANYSAEYMASVLAHNLSDISKVAFLIEECRRMGLKVLPPAANESMQNFSVNSEGNIRFGLAAIKGVGSGLVEAIIEERNLAGEYKDIFDFCSRLNGRQINKRVLEALANAGAFDAFPELIREQYLTSYPGSADITLLDKALQFGTRSAQEKLSSQVSLFGGSMSAQGEAIITYPAPPPPEPLPLITKLEQEKSVLGIYLSAHPLDRYQKVLQFLSVIPLSTLDEYVVAKKEIRIRLAGVLCKFREALTRNGKPYISFRIEDFTGGADLVLFGEGALKFKHILSGMNQLLFITGTVGPRFKGAEQFEFQVNEIRLLDEALKQQKIKLEVQILVTALTEETVENLFKIVEKHPGSHSMRIKLKLPPVSDLEMEVKEKTVELCPELFQELERQNFSFNFKA